jgi:hypothetical protein
MSSGGGGGGDTTTVQKADPWAGQQPYLAYGFQQAQKNYDSGGPQYYPTSTVADFSPQTQQALQLTQDRAVAGSPVTRASQAQATATLNGDYLNNNPYLDSIWNQGAGDIQSRVAGQFGAAGRTGSGINQQVLSRELANGYNNLYGANYQAERGRQLQTQSLVPQISQLDYADIDRLGQAGSMIDQQNQAQLSDKVNRFNYNQNLPDQNLQRYVAAIQGNYGGATNTTVDTASAKRNWLSGAAGGALTGAALGSSVFPGLGTAAGAVAGGLLGAFA